MWLPIPYSIEPRSVSDQPKREDLVVAYENLTNEGPLPGRGPDTSTFWQRIYYLQFLSYVYM